MLLEIFDEEPVEPAPVVLFSEGFEVVGADVVIDVGESALESAGPEPAVVDVKVFPLAVPADVLGS
tara:strand:- start:8522 stop:8719 length:198 start_codon:yes stop_codon:yes gene_type:complete